MKFIKKSGKLEDIPLHKYRVDWEGDQGSKFSEEVLDFLYPYWKNDAVYAEVPVAGANKRRFDFMNISKKIIIETDGKQHDQFSKHFHGGSTLKYLAQIKRDIEKDEVAARNGFLMIRVKPHDLPLTKAFFKDNYNIML